MTPKICTVKNKSKSVTKILESCEVKLINNK